MTTSEPQADDDRDHRSIGQRIRDAVIGDPVDTRHDEHGHSDEHGNIGEHGHTDEHGDAGRSGGYGDPQPGATTADAGHADPERGAVWGAPGQADTTDRDEYTGPARHDVLHDDTPVVDPPRGDHDPFGPATREPTTGTLADPARDDVPRGAGRPGGVGSGYADPTDTPVGAAGSPSGSVAAAPDDRGLGTSSYDPNHDTGYVDEGRATTDRTTGHGDADYDTGRVDTGRSDTGYDTGRSDTGYDTGRVDTGRSGTGYGDTGYGDTGFGGDTGYGDTGRSDTGFGDTGRGDTGHDTPGGAGTAGAVAAGGTATAGVAAARHGRADERDDAFSEVDDTSAVHPTTTGPATPDVPASGATPLSSGAPVGATTGAPVGSGATAPVGPTDGAAGAGTGTGASGRAEAVKDEAGGRAGDEVGGKAAGPGTQERLVPADRAKDYSSRWDALKGDFVDEPRRAVAQADDLVGELLDEIQRLFSDQRRDLEQGLDHDSASTEDLRLALRRYRSFFDRLLSF